ncbi:hypothetical protein [Fulvimarina sp. MAC3]
MPATTMVFSAEEPLMLNRAGEAQMSEFVAKRLRGKLTVIDMR